MSFRVSDALPILIGRYGQTINKVPTGARAGLENRKVRGFRTSAGRVLVLDVYPENADRVRLWIEPPMKLAIANVSVLLSKRCADLERAELRPLSAEAGIYVEVETRAALDGLLAWYE
jgi:hypothetical protein